MNFPSLPFLRRFVPRFLRSLAIAVLPCTAGLAIEPEPREIGGVRYHIVTTTPERIRLMWADDKGRPLRTFAALSDHLATRKLNADLLMNGGIFEPGGIPSGLYVQGGRELRPVNRRAGEGNFYLRPNGIFFLTPRGAGGSKPPSGPSREPPSATPCNPAPSCCAGAGSTLRSGKSPNPASCATASV